MVEEDRSLAIWPEEPASAVGSRLGPGLVGVVGLTLTRMEEGWEGGAGTREEGPQS